MSPLADHTMTVYRQFHRLTMLGLRLQRRPDGDTELNLLKINLRLVPLVDELEQLQQQGAGAELTDRQRLELLHLGDQGDAAMAELQALP